MQVIDFNKKIDFYVQKVFEVIKNDEKAKVADIIEQILCNKSMAWKSAVLDRVSMYYFNKKMATNKK